MVTYVVTSYVQYKVKKVFKKFLKSFWSSCLLNFLPNESTQTDRYSQRDIITTVMPLNMHKNLENMHNRDRKLAIYVVKFKLRVNFEKN